MDKSLNRRWKMGVGRWGLLLSSISYLLSSFALGQTHTMPGSNVVPSGASLTIQSGGTLTAAGGSTITGIGGGNVSNTGTPTAAQKATWVDATHIQGVTDNALQWDGGATNLVAATGRTSLGLGTAATTNATAYEVPLTFSTGLTRSTNTVTVNTSQNIATLSNLTTNGFVKTGGAVGTLSVDTATYQASAATLTSWAAITRASGFDTFVATPSSANLRGLLTDENGTGAALFSGATTPDFTTGFTIGAAAASNYELTGNGTNFVPKASDIPNGSSAQQTGFASNTYLAGSVITISAGDFKVGSTYRCMFDMAKTTAGTAAPVITIYIGTGGAITDTAAQTITFAAATGVADTGMFEVWVNFRAVGASATIASVGTCMHNLAATGLTSTGAAGTATVSNSTSSTFNSTTFTKIGVAFNGGASYVGTNNLCQAYYSNP